MAMIHEELRYLKPDALTPAEIEAKAERVGCTKAGMPGGKCFVSAVLAGAFIALGATFFCLVLGDTSIPAGMQRLVGSVCFCLGLALVLCCGAELFTGNVLMLCARASGRICWTKLLRNWGIVWVGNLVGSLIVVALVFFSNTQGMYGGAVGTVFVSVAAGKAALDVVSMFFKAVLCNILVCLAVWIGFSARTVTDKIIGILLPISAFVAIGFEHSVANMFFMPMGLLMDMTGAGAPGAVTLGGVVFNLVIVTLGNIAGGGLVGIAYWFVYHKELDAH